MKKFLTAAVAAMALTVAVEARGQDGQMSGDVVPVTSTMILPTGPVGDCIRRCFETAEQCEEARRQAREGWRRLLERISTIETRISELDGRVGGLATRVDRVESELTQLRTELVQLRTELDRQATLLVAIDNRLGSIETLVGELRGDLQEANGRIDELIERVTELEERRPIVYRLPGVNVLALWGSNDLRYTGALISASGVEFNFTPRFSVVLDGGLVADGSDRPLGVFVRGELGWNIRRSYGVWRFGLALQGMWTGLDESLHAEAAFITAAPQASFRFDRAQWLEIHVSVPSGVGITGGEVSPVVGVEGGIALRWEF